MAVKDRLKGAVNRVRYRWPRKMVIEELFNNDDGLHDHLHVASKDRKKLIRIAHIAKHRYGGSDPAPVREFPPFDTVENVHTFGSWHYRDSKNPTVQRDFSNRGNGLAFDLRSARRQAFGDALKRRYHVRESDF